MIKPLFDRLALGAIVKSRVDICGSLRAAEAESGIDHNTLGRISNGAPPSIETFFQLGQWIDGSPPKLPGQ